FFFHVSGDLLDLHSFPTRRSSDLQPALAEQEGAGELGHREALARRHAQLGECIEPGERQPTRRFELPSKDGLQRLVRRQECAQGDRKSTRLNSSHVAISYAVFCLK